MGIFGAFILLFWIISGTIANLPRLLRQSPLAAVATILTLLFLVGMLYSPAGWEEILSVFKKYRELLFIPAVLSLMLDESGKNRDTAVSAFFAGCIILMIISYAMALGILPSVRYGSSITYHITHSFFMAILAFWTLHRVTDVKRYKVAWALLLAAVIGNIIYIAPGRTGMITLFALAVLFIWQRFSWQKKLIGLLVFTLFTTLAIYSSENIRTRINDGLNDIRTYQHGISRSSLGMRFDWWYDCLLLVREKPVFGHGTGSFTTEHNRLIQETLIEPTDNPHNEYLFIAVQLGIIGLLAFLGLFVAGWLDARKQPPDRRWLAQGVIISMMTGCLANSFLFDSHQGHYFAILVALLCIPPLNRSEVHEETTL